MLNNGMVDYYEVLGVRVYATVTAVCCYRSWHNVQPVGLACRLFSLRLFHVPVSCRGFCLAILSSLLSNAPVVAVL